MKTFARITFGDDCDFHLAPRSHVLSNAIPATEATNRRRVTARSRFSSRAVSRRVSEFMGALVEVLFLEPPNGMRLSCGALKKDSFHNLRAPPASSAC